MAHADTAYTPLRRVLIDLTNRTIFARGWAPGSASPC